MGMRIAGLIFKVTITIIVGALFALMVGFIWLSFFADLSGIR